MFTKTTLKNRLRLLTIPMSGVDSVTILFLVAAGSRYETPEQNGIAHFAEHMFFKGTVKRPSAKEIAAEIDGVGGVINAFTGEEYTGFYVKVPHQEFDRGLDVLADMLQHATFASKEIKRERGVIVEEINMVEDQPQRKVFDVYRETVYGKTPLGRPIAGRKDVVTALTRDDFIRYRRTFFTPDNIVLSIAGKLPPSVQSRVEPALRAMKGRRTRSYQRQADRQRQLNTTLLRRKSEQAHLILGVRAFRRDHHHRYALAVLNTILGANMSSRLFLEVRERRGLAYAIHSSEDVFRDVGTWLVYAGVDLNKVATCAKVILSELARIRDERASADELRRAKAYLKGRFMLRFEDTEEVASFFAMEALLEKEIFEPKQVFAKIDAVTEKDVQDVARKIMRREGLNIAVVGQVSSSQEKQLRTISF